MSEITLRAPIVIGPTLEPAAKVKDKYITFDTGTGAFTVPGIGIVSDIHGPNVQLTDSEYVRKMFAALFSFLGAYAESLPDGENSDLFPIEFAEWATENNDEFGMLSYELEEC